MIVTGNITTIKQKNLAPQTQPVYQLSYLAFSSWVLLTFSFFTKCEYWVFSCLSLILYYHQFILRDRLKTLSENKGGGQEFFNTCQGFFLGTFMTSL